MQAVIFQHTSSGGPGALLEAVRAHNINCRIMTTAYEDIADFDALAPDLLIVMGGAPGVYQASDYPFLQHEQRILEKRLAADRPTIGICLGAQLIAAAMGAKVYKGEHGPEIGWFDMTLTAAGQSSPVNAFEATKIMQWHGDTFDFPAGATLLAGSQKYPHHIFTHGRNVIAFQGHIEVTADILADWYVDDAALFVKHSERLHALRQDTAQYVKGMTNATQTFMKEWLADVLPQREAKHA